MKNSVKSPVRWFLVLLSVCPLLAISQESNADSAFKQEELDQLLAPIALYPDSLLAQMFMASTYPLQITQANKWIKDNNDLKGDELAKALEGRNWDPSVKSLVNFPDVLQMMSDKLDYTQKLGDAFLSQQKDVMDTVQKLRKKAQEKGNLKTSEKQVVTDDQQIISIEPNNSEATYLPEYDPYSVYGDWWWPVYPPYYWYPNWDNLKDRLQQPRPTPYSLREGIKNGSAWGYAWGRCDWRSGNVGIDMSRNTNLNSNINRDYYTKNYQKAGQFDQSGKGTWQHNPADRRGVPYRDQATAQKYNRASTPAAAQSREAYRGRTGQADPGTVNRPEIRQSTAQRPSAAQRQESRDTSSNISNRGGALNGIDSGSAARNASNRGQMSRQSMPSPQPQIRTAPVQQPMRMPMRGGGRRR
jgi:hypothetical protein